MDDRYLGIYLNDHLAGATAGLELARRSAGRNRRSDFGAELEKIAGEIEQDRDSLKEVMRRLGVTENVAKTSVAWIAERVGRLKLNGQLLSYSPLSRVEELEALHLGVQGKLDLWVALKGSRGSDGRLAQVDLDELARRAGDQRDRLEELRLRAAEIAFGGASRKRTSS